MNFIDILEKLAPLLAFVIPGKYMQLITAAIAIAEASGKSGKDKKQIALASVRAGAEAANLIAGHTVIDPDKAVTTADRVVDMIVALVNRNLSLSATNTHSSGVGQLGSVGGLGNTVLDGNWNIDPKK